MTLFHRISARSHAAIFALVIAVLAVITAAALSFFLLDQDVFIQVLPANTLVGFVVAFGMSYYVGTKIVMINFLTGELDRLASDDFLTGAQTRRKFFSRFSSENPVSGSVIVLDLDRFKQINDTFGHAAGDQALKQVAAAIRNLIGDRDHFCRMGGDEFCIFLEGADWFSANRIAKRIMKYLSEQFIGEGNAAMPLRASTGIAQKSPGDDIGAAIALADKALITQKSRFKSKWPAISR